MVDPPSSPCSSPHPGVAAQQSPSPKKPSQRRASYSIAEKKSIVSKVKKLMARHQYSIQSACEKVGVCHSQFLRWQKPLPIALQVIKKTKKKIHPGKSSILKAYEDILLKFVSELRNTGMPVNSKMVQLEASRLSHEFREKSKNAKQSIVQRFLKTHGIIYCNGTHESQKAPEEAKECSLDFMITVRQIVNQNNRHPRYIYNCDQSGIFYTNCEKNS